MTIRRSLGKGIGLSIVKKIVELNVRRVWMESKVGAGSTFLFTLPVQMTAQCTECQPLDMTC
ncbi:MAG: hypothetical protein AMJ65_04380 [Phycisphaerae bacterium SG8_4]|nr:MAG: hypothetical protein AMJ65_04380 [Phycisphaerae bacterium SG8_4]